MEKAELLAGVDLVSRENNEGSDVDQICRKSVRPRKLKRSFSPIFQEITHRPKKALRKSHSSSHACRAASRIGDTLPNDTCLQPFSCDQCHTPYICNPSKRGNFKKRSKKSAPPRYKVNPNTGVRLTLCNACGLSFGHVKHSAAKPKPTQDEKALYLIEAKDFGKKIAELLNEKLAERIYCPNFKLSPCRCIQRYIDGDVTIEPEESKRRAEGLLSLLTEAALLSAKKYHDGDAVDMTTKTNRGMVGIGNGMRKSVEFENFVLDKRRRLKDELKFCELGIQRLLIYSNNFLHRALKTESRGRRLEKVYNIKESLKPIKYLTTVPCCGDKCVKMAFSHPTLLKEWRDRAQSGQIEARRVLAEMLTPSGGARINCYRFIRSVTGCCSNTIGKVATQMQKTGGDRNPPKHGLKSYWHGREKQTHTLPDSVLLNFLKKVPEPNRTTSMTSAINVNLPPSVPMHTITSPQVFIVPGQSIHSETTHIVHQVNSVASPITVNDGQLLQLPSTVVYKDTPNSTLAGEQPTHHIVQTSDGLIMVAAPNSSGVSANGSVFVSRVRNNNTINRNADRDPSQVLHMEDIPASEMLTQPVGMLDSQMETNHDRIVRFDDMSSPPQSSAGASRFDSSTKAVRNQQDVDTRRENETPTSELFVHSTEASPHKAADLTGRSVRMMDTPTAELIQIMEQAQHKVDHGGRQDLSLLQLISPINLMRSNQPSVDLSQMPFSFSRTGTPKSEVNALSISIAQLMSQLADESSSTTPVGPGHTPVTAQTPTEQLLQMLAPQLFPIEPHENIDGLPLDNEHTEVVGDIPLQVQEDNSSSVNMLLEQDVENNGPSEVSHGSILRKLQH